MIGSAAHTWIDVALTTLNVLQTIALAYLAASHKRNGHL